MKHVLWIIVTLCLTACQVAAPAPTVTPASTPTPLTAQQIIDYLVAADLEINEIEQLARPEGMPEHYQFKDRWGFTIAEVAPRGGQVYTCELRPHCDLLIEFFKAFESLGGKYYYLAPDGLAVIQLNREVSPETAAKFEKVIQGLP